MLLPPWETVEVETTTVTPEPATHHFLAAALAQGLAFSLCRNGLFVN
jgi:hypothetical protein